MDQAKAVRFNDELVIDFKEFFWRLLEQWKAIIVVSLVVMLLFSMLMYYRSNMAYQSINDAQQGTESIEDILGSLNDKDRDAVQGTIRLKENLDDLRKYVYTSLFMNLDPYKVQTFTASILINSDDFVNKQLVLAYSNEFVSLNVARVINHAWDDMYSDEQIEELIKIENGISVDSEVSMEGNILNVSVYIPDGADASKVSEAIDACLQSISEKMYGIFGEHSATIISSDVQFSFDKDCSDKQYDVLTKLYNITSQLNYLTGLLTTEQKEAYESIVNYIEVEEDEDSDMVIPGPKMFTKRNVLMGLILGCLMYVFVYLIYYVFSGRIFGDAIMREKYSLRTLGDWYAGNRKRFPLSLLSDRLIGKTRHAGHLDMHSEVNKACESISSALSDERKDKLILIGRDEAKESAKLFVEELTSKLKANSIKTEICEINISKGNVIGEKTLTRNDGIVIAIDKSVTRLSDVKDIIEKSAYCNVPIVGAVYTE